MTCFVHERVSFDEIFFRDDMSEMIGGLIFLNIVYHSFDSPAHNFKTTPHVSRAHRG
jgi:hypothetical protein